VDPARLSEEIDRFDPRVPIESAWTPPSSWYTAPDIHALECRAVLAATWQPVARLEQLQRPGDFVAGCLLGEPFVVVRGADDVLRAFHNTCRHKGREVVQGAGTAQELVCGYHAWTYDLAGKLRSAPRMAGIRDFDRERMSLPRLVPFRFQRVRYQAVVGVDLHITSARQIALVACALDFLVAQAIALLGAILQLLLDRQRDLQRQRCERLDQQLPDGIIERPAMDLLADRLCALNAPALAHVIGHPTSALDVIAHGHSLAAVGAYRQALQQSGALARSPPLAIGPLGVSVVAQPLEVVLELLPADVGFVGVVNQRRPLLGRQPHEDVVTIESGQPIWWPNFQVC
jgi:nitrite reductase/ring-hydroxylating ferredoxin subunit